MRVRLAAALLALVLAPALEAEAVVLGRRAAAVRARARREAGRRARRAGSLGLRGAEGRRRARLDLRADVVEAPPPLRAERDPRLPPERLGHEARHRLRG